MTFVATVNSYANLEPGALPLGQGWSQNVANAGIAFQHAGSSAPIWGGWLVAQNTSGTPQSVGKGAIVGLEINVGITGTDTVASSVGIACVPGAIATGLCSAFVAFWASGDANQTWQNGFLASQATYAAFNSVANGQYGLALSGNAGTAAIKIGASTPGGTQYLMEIGSTAGCWSDGAHTHATARGYLKVKVDATVLYIPLYE